MASFVVLAGTTQTARIDMSGTDDLTVQATGTLSVSANNQSVRFNGATTGALIVNSGTIENTVSRAIRIETSVGATFTATITNNATGIITSPDDAIQIQAGSVVAGTLTIGNAGSITSTTGQALDLAGGTGAAAQNVTNSGTISANANDAIRFGGVGTLINTGTINGGTNAAYTVSGDGVGFEDNSSGSVTNNTGGAISGDRHAIDGGTGTTVTVTNALGATITGRNGSGVGLDGDGTVTNFGTITGNFANIAGSDVNGTMIGQPDGGGPDGIPDGDGDGIDIDGLATVQNSGLIEGTGAGGSGSDGRLNTSEAIAAGGGTFTNFATGIIRGLGLGMLIDDSSTGPAPFVTTVVNAGIIEGTNSFAIRIIGTQNDTIENSGSISGGGGIAIQMGGGDDTLKILTGSAITGTSQGEGGTDTLDYSAFGAAVAVDLVLGTATGTGGVAGFETVIGSAQADDISGSDGADTLSGGGGDDKINGGLGDDAMAGGGGNDLFYFRDAGDTATENLNEGTADKVISRVNVAALADNVERLTMGTAAALDGTGNGLANLLYGNAGANVFSGAGGSDVIYGNGGDDTLDGGAGVDTLWGGAGADLFRFTSLVENNSAALRDTIRDFEVGVDNIDLLAFGFLSLVNGPFTGVAGQLRVATGANTFVYGDLNGDRAADFYLVLSGVVPLTLGDFIL